MPRQKMYSKVHREKVLEYLRNNPPILGMAARHVGIARRTLYNWIDKDEEFKKAIDEACECGMDVLEDEAWERARKKSDTLYIFLLRGRRRSVFGDLGPGPAVIERTEKVTIGFTDTNVPTLEERKLPNENDTETTDTLPVSTNGTHP